MKDAAAAKKIKKFVSQFFSQNEYPCLSEQFDRFSNQKPIQGLQILFVAPLFKNTLPSLLPLFASEATVEIALPPFIPYDETVVDFIRSIGVSLRFKLEGHRHYDVILDCCGSFSHLDPKFGFAELTMSGRKNFEPLQKTCVMIDDSEVKLLEDAFGTGDGFWRALHHLGLISLDSKKSFVLFGHGKVGKGISRKIRENGHHLVIVEVKDRPPNLDPKINWFRADEREKLEASIETADFIVTATGRAGFVSDAGLSTQILRCGAILANMGAEDEFGPLIPTGDRVLNQKRPVNFVLENPTLLKFLDPVFALRNEAAPFLATETLPLGILGSRDADEKRILEIYSQAHNFDLSELRTLV